VVDILYSYACGLGKGGNDHWLSLKLDVYRLFISCSNLYYETYFQSSALVFVLYLSCGVI